MKHKHILIGVVLLGAALVLAACSSQPAPIDTAACPTAEACPDCPTCPEVVVKEVPFEALWAASPHNDATAEAFTHWDEEDPKEVPANCAKCHSTPGYLDFLGEDGSAAGAVDKAAEIGTTITCVACHNTSTAAMTSVVFPSGAEVSGLGAEARCMQCHQGRASKVQVDAALEKNGLTEDLDTVNAELGFVNIHYFAAASTLYGTQTMGGYEYEGKAYDYKNDHVAGFDTCIGCHNSHTLEVKVDSCKTCHTGVASKEDLKKIRMQGSLVDYDGDGDVSESIASELEGLQGMLLQAIQAYAKEVAGSPIVYEVAAHPYFFYDTNDNGAVDEGEAASANSYKSWTGRMLKAAYNYQTSLKDPGAYAHGGKYMIQLVYDSIEDLNSVLSSPVDLGAANRIDAGHFAGSEEAFRHWDGDGEVPGTCARCHSASGLPTYLKNAANIAVEPVNGLNCATCHNDLATFTRFTVNEVTFPSGAKVSFGEENDANLCLACHQGRESKKSVDGAIAAAAVGDDEVSDKLRFRNPHYFAAGATLFGTDAKGAYEYDGETYYGRFLHVEGLNSCIGCHDGHALKVKQEACSTCHTGITELTAIRMTQGDFDGDGDTTEGMAGEVATMQEKLYAAIQAYATETAGAGLVYSGLAYPYFFVDTNADGVADADELNSDNAFAAWTPSLLRAAYNLQWATKDPGAFAHNGKYILQVLYDSLADLGGDTAGMTRP
ncbi:MAG: cytochrome c3 family protein [Anaerolineales bacterium]|nr:cytochrome c3 family protein [Anaerolineales bacterium]